MLVISPCSRHSCGMANLITGFIKVAQSGPTCDGRKIEAQDLREIAETYNPATYTAVIWPDHDRFYGNHGTVAAVEVRENGDITELWAQLQPGWRFLEKNREGQKQFSSIEIWDNFADSGKCYLAGIAITDSPASLGTEQIKLFSARRGDAVKSRFCPGGVELPNFFASPNTQPPAVDSAGKADPETAQALSFVRGLGRLFGFYKSEPDSEETMDKQQFDALNEKLDGLSKRVEALSAKPADDAAASGEASADTASAQQHQQQAAPAADTAKPDAFSAADLGKQLNSLTDTVGKLADQFGAMAKRMEGEKGGSTQFETSGPAGDADIL